MSFIAEFREKVFTFLSDHDWSDSGFGRAALGDPNFVRDLRRGRSPGERTIVKVEKFMTRWLEKQATREKIECLMHG